MSNNNIESYPNSDQELADFYKRQSEHMRRDSVLNAIIASGMISGTLSLTIIDRPGPAIASGVFASLAAIYSAMEFAEARSFEQKSEDALATAENPPEPN